MMTFRKGRVVLGAIVVALCACDVDDQDPTNLEALEAEEADGEEAAGEEQDENEGAVEFRAATDFGDSCYWNKVSGGTTSAITVTCDYGDRIVSGGCYSYEDSDQIYISMPWEASSTENFPEDGERVDSTTLDTGWRCARDGSTNNFYGVALCCDF